MMCASYEDPQTLFIFCIILLNMENVSEKVVDEIETTFMFSNFC
jgi:hypothetical protein